MGLDCELFLDDDKFQNFVCAICLDVFVDPVMLTTCECSFCRKCILGVLEENPETFLNCPIDEKPFTESSIRKPFPFVLNLLKNLQMKCKFSPECDKIILYENFDDHLFNCSFNPLNNILCTKGIYLIFSSIVQPC